jgi:hypothetical protein
MRTKLLLAAACLAGAAPAFAADYVTTVESTGPLAYWRLDGANQPSTNGTYTTTYTNVTTSAAGTGAPLAGDADNRAASFDGLGSDSNITTSLSGMIPGRGTINAWINLSTLASSTGRIFYIAGESTYANDFDFQLSPEDRLGFCVGVGGGQCLQTGNVGAQLLGGWHMVTAAYDGTAGAGTDSQTIWIDGAVATTRSDIDLDGRDHANPFTIGYSSVFGNREFAGLIDEVAVWNRALSASEVATLYAARLDAGDGSPTVPEPATWATMLLGFGLVGGRLRRRAARTVTA